VCAAFARRTPFGDIHCPELVAAKQSLAQVSCERLKVADTDVAKAWQVAA
jgi:hypothetical protein